MSCASTSTSSGCARSTGAYCLGADLVDDRAVARAHRGGPRLAREQRHLADHGALAHRVDEHVLAVVAPQQDLELAVGQHEQRAALLALDDEPLGGPERQRAGGARERAPLVGSSGGEDRDVGDQRLDLGGRALVGLGQLRADLELGPVAVVVLQQRDARGLVDVRLEQADLARDALAARVVHQAALLRPAGDVVHGVAVLGAGRPEETVLIGEERR